MRTTYRYKAYRINKSKRHKTERLLGLTCWCYNHCIALHKRYYRMYHRALGEYDLEKHLTKLKRHVGYENWGILSSQSIQQIAEKISEGYKKFFKRQAKRPPTFRSQCKYKSVTFKNTGGTLNGNVLAINALKLRIKFHKSRELDGTIKTVTFKRDAVGDLWICFSLDNAGNQTKTSKTGQTAGFDFGMKTFLTLSDGTRIELVHLHRRIENRREDFLWKVANDLVNRYDLPCFEDLNTKKIQQSGGSW